MGILVLLLVFGEGRFVFYYIVPDPAGKDGFRHIPLTSPLHLNLRVPYYSDLDGSLV